MQNAARYGIKKKKRGIFLFIFMRVEKKNNFISIIVSSNKKILIDFKIY